jgi:oxygen-independent coproporphyrinogen-3 oxidase
MDDYSLYLHVPFCRHRCSYCDFNTFAGQDRLIPAYADALCNEIRQVGLAAGERLPVHTVFFGGGTPSLLSDAQVGSILETLRESFSFQEPVEITLEANPGTVSPDGLRKLRLLGVNRLSFGMQSAHPDDLRMLERQHDFFDVARAVQWARAAGFDNLSVDLIFGLPGQDLRRWADTLNLAVGLDTEHISLYALTIEHGTPLMKRWTRGLIPLVDEALAADMYELAMDDLAAAGFVQYEISNWAREGPEGTLRTCVHNLQYWRNLPYLGFGAGAHGYARLPDGPPGGGIRTINVGGIRPFIQRCTAPPAAVEFPAGPAARRVIAVDRFTEMQETMMVGLRLTQEGVSARGFARRFGEPLAEVFGREIDRLLRLGLLEWVENGDVLRLTRRGRMLGNQVFMQFVGQP